MHGQGVKNFILSFLFSLLAVVGVNKVFTSAPEDTATSTKSPLKTQSISLFSVPADSQKKTVNNTIDVSEIDKLTASVLHNIPDTEKAPEVAIGSLPPPPPDATQHVITAADLPGLTPTLENTADLINSQAEMKKKSTSDLPKAVKNKVNTDLAAAQEIVLEKENVITVAKVDNDYEKSGIVYADISDTFETETAEPAKESNVVYAPETDDDIAPKEKILLAESKPALPDINKSNVIEEGGIPLTEGSETLHSHINVAQSANAAQIAMLEPNNLVSTIETDDFTEEKTLAEADLKQNEWTQMSEQSENDSPWVVAKGNKFAKNQAVVEYFAEEEQKAEVRAAEDNLAQKAAKSDEKKVTEALKPEGKAESEKETKVAYQMIQNLLIPIPEDIMNDTNLTPQLTASPDDKKADDTEKEAEKNAAKKTAVDESKLNDDEKQSGLFKSIASWFSSDKDGEQNGSQPTTKKTAKKKSGIDFFGFVSGDDNGQGTTQILPAELRLSFQPNRAEISGQTLRWIHAFADSARDNDDMYIEIRIDGTSSFALQKKRLNLLSTILANRGVDFRKINIVFTSREPNSFIIRNIRFNNDEEVVVNQNSNNAYYRPW